MLKGFLQAKQFSDSMIQTCKLREVKIFAREAKTILSHFIGYIFAVEVKW